MPRFRRLQHTFLAVALVVSLVPLAALGAYGYARISASLEESAIAETRARLDRAARRMETALAQSATDLSFLSRLPVLQRLLDLPTDADAETVREVKAHLSTVFAAFARAKRVYHQIRYLDEHGREVVRVDFDRGAVRVVPESDLQDKSDRYYFTVAMRMGRGELFVSPLDLNRERGGVEVPYRPTLRYATPVFSTGGEPRGIVITNLHAGPFLDEACKALEPATGVCFSADENGYYTMHADSAKTWGSDRDLGTGEGLQRDFPGEWERLLRGGAGRVAVPDGILFSSPVHPPPEGAGRTWVVGKVYARSVVLGPLRAFRPVFAGLVVGALLLAAVLAAVLARRVTAPLTVLRAGAERIGAGDLDHIIHITAHDETGALARDFNAMAARLKTYVRDLQETTAARERASAELRVATGIQRTMLPEALPPFPGADAVDVVARYRPAREVGGDFYNYFLLDDHRIALVVGDVSGKGVPAALVMAMTQTLIRSFAEETASPAEILRRTNRMLVAETEVGVFVTAFTGIYDTRDGRLVWANAGHLPPVLVAADGAVRELAGSDLLLGVAEDAAFDIEDRTAALTPGDRLVVFTDGVTEAADTAGRLFDLAGLEATLQGHRGDSLEDLCDAVVTAVLEHQSGRPQTDDITLLAIEARPLTGPKT